MCIRDSSITEGGTPGGGDEDQTVEVKFKKMDPEHFHPGNYDTAHVDFADKDDDSSAFDDIAGAGIRIEGDGQGAGEYTLPCTVELGEGTFTAVSYTHLKESKEDFANESYMIKWDTFGKSPFVI